MIDKEKINEAKSLLKILKKSQKRGIHSNIFALLKDDIFKLKEKGLSNNAIATLLSDLLKEDINERNLASWLYRQKSKKGVQNVKEKLSKEKNEGVETENEDDEIEVDNFLTRAKKLTK